MKLCRSIRQGVFQPTLELNLEVLAEELHAQPSKLLPRLCSYTCRIERETGMERANIYELAGRMGVMTSVAQFRHDMHLNPPKDEEDLMRGEAVPVPSGGKVIGAVKASEGAVALKPEASA